MAGMQAGLRPGPATKRLLPAARRSPLGVPRAIFGYVGFPSGASLRRKSQLKRWRGPPIPRPRRRGPEDTTARATGWVRAAKPSLRGRLDLTDSLSRDHLEIAQRHQLVTPGWLDHILPQINLEPGHCPSRSRTCIGGHPDGGRGIILRWWRHGCVHFAMCGSTT